jgi:hypothetical protein
MDAETKKDLIKFVICVLIPVGAWLVSIENITIPSQAFTESVIILGASLVGSVVAFLQGLIGGIQGLLRKFRKPKTPTPTPTPQ